MAHQSNLMPEKVNKISVLRKMIGLDKKKPAKDYVVPNNSAFNLQQQKSGIVDPPISQVIENTISFQGNDMNNNSNSNSKCPHCENMAKNFLYLESLIRNNSDKGEHKCNLCASSLKYLQYVNRNIMQVFGNTDSIARAARSFSKQPPPQLKYSVAKPQQLQQVPQKQLGQRAKGGAVITKQRSAKSLKPKTATKTTTTTSKTTKSVVKSLKSNKSSKSLKSLKSVKSAKSSKSLRKTTKAGKSNSPKSPTGSKSKFSHGKMTLKRKYRSMPKQTSHGKMIRSASQYHSLGIIRSKLANKAKKQKQLATTRKQRNNKDAQPTSINWNLLKRNLPKRFKTPLATK